jgi:hypothetical protein
MPRKYIFNILAGKPKGKRHLGRRRRTWENNISIDLRLKGFKINECISLHYERTYGFRNRKGGA